MTNSKGTTSKINSKNGQQDLDPRCCQTGCPDCPFGFQEQFDPDIPIELQKGVKTSETADDYQKYVDMADE